MNGSTNISIQPSFRVARSDAIIAAEIDESVVMMDVEKGRYYELNAVGARIWDLVEASPRVAQVCGAVTAEYEVSRTMCSEEVRLFLERLCDLGVVRLQPGDDPKEAAGTDTRVPHCAEDASPPKSLPQSRLPWTTPAVRFLAISERTQGDFYDAYGDTETHQYTVPVS